MKTLLLWLLALLLGLAAGALSALWLSGWLTGATPLAGARDVELWGWRANWAVGSEAADPYTRAFIAKRGLLALNQSEAVYFARDVDSDGRPLSESCVYRLSGTDMPARWWSVTLYAADDYLAPNADGAHSVDASDYAVVESWSAAIAPERPDDAVWLSSRGAGRFNLLLRLYNPRPELLQAPEDALRPPRVERVSCEGRAP